MLILKLCGRASLAPITKTAGSHLLIKPQTSRVSIVRNFGDNARARFKTAEQRRKTLTEAITKPVRVVVETFVFTRAISYEKSNARLSVQQASPLPITIFHFSYEDVENGLYRVIQVDVEPHASTAIPITCRCYEMISVPTPEHCLTQQQNVNTHLEPGRKPATWYMKNIIDSSIENEIPEYYITELKSVPTVECEFRE
ncbi:uncharacterized protein LOC108252738 [Diaphorina citri]|uniref:Uncharacterized protein LOC108252738 n=1 Tax=Diaphorina citri TaxID=121845 RepID=A0A3Q0IYZ7_DIACI|nr:uncharacterized protein LOC108252738 [Diaphorina citri]